MQRLWIILGSLVTVPVLGMSTYNVVALLAHEEVTETATFDAAGLTTLDLDSDNGRVEIVGHDRDDVVVDAGISHGLRRTSYDAEVVGDTVRVRSSCPLAAVAVWCSVDHRVAVPADLTVHVANDNGSITVRDLDGAVTVDNDNGPVELARVGGTVDARTSNGSLHARGLRGRTVDARTSNGSVELAFAEAPATVEAHTSNGSVDVVVPEDDAPYTLDVDARFTGSTDTAVRTDPTAERSIAATTSNGSVTVRYPTG